MTSLKEKLMHDIKHGKVSMTPRIYFTLRFMALIATSIAILVVTIFIINFISFSIRISMHDALLGFGTRGVEAFLKHFPWPFLLADIGLIVLLQHLVRNFSFGYRVPVLYLASGLIVFAAILGILMDRATPFNDVMHERRSKLPPGARGMYEGVRPPHPGSGICRCKILSIEGNVLQVEDLRPGVSATSTLTVVLPMDSRRATTTDLSVGDIVFIAGEEGDIIEAFGVKKADGRREKR
jgi:hypothetical protein